MPNIAHSIRSRLLNLARKQGIEFQSLLTRFAVERLLRRLEKSRHRDAFVMKGATLFSAWLDRPHRPTRDVDFLGLNEGSVAEIADAFREIVGVRVEDDGLVFESDSIQGQEIREGQTYQGVRLDLPCSLAGARIRVQVDIGFGDVIVPGAVTLEFPTLLDMSAPTILTYPKETVVAEKFEALVKLGITNSRMKDFYNLWALAREYAFEGPVLGRALAKTFERRRTALPRETPLALTREFTEDGDKQKQWRAFLKKGRLGATALDAVTAQIDAFLMLVARGASEPQAFQQHWEPGGPWSSTSS